MTDQTTSPADLAALENVPTTKPTVIDVRRALVAESADFAKRRQPYGRVLHKPEGTQADFDAYEGLATAGCYGWVLAVILRKLAEDHGEQYAGVIAAAVHEVMTEGIDGWEDANSDLDAQTPDLIGTIPINPTRACPECGADIDTADITATFTATPGDTVDGTVTVHVRVAQSTVTAPCGHVLARTDHTTEETR